MAQPLQLSEWCRSKQPALVALQERSSGSSEVKAGQPSEHKEPNTVGPVTKMERLVREVP